MEEEAHCLDFQVAPSSSAAAQGSVAIDTYVTNLRRLSSLREERDRVQQKSEVVEQVLTLSAVNQSATFTTTPALVEAMMEEATKLRSELQDLVSSSPSNQISHNVIDMQDKTISDLEVVTRKGFDKGEGPFVKSLDAALASFNVERQAYYSGTFVGNHVQRCLMVCIIRNVHRLL